MGTSRRLLRHPARPHSCDVPQFLLSPSALAVYRHPVGPRREGSSVMTDVQNEERSELLAGLTAHPPRVSPRYFYDEIGSRLFDRITRTPEYYPTRTELAILRDH